MFGPEDDFFNKFAAMARILPALPLIGGGETKFQPVFVGDVAEAIARAVDGAIAACAGATYELGGPEVRSFRQLMEYVLDGDRAPALAHSAAVPAGAGCRRHSCNICRRRCSRPIRSSC